jgi:glycine/D-amino acid oxidase-like deaminating enzyme
MPQDFWGDFSTSSFPALQKNASAQYLIVGGGISGLASAYFLLKHGATNITLIEQNTIGSGSTGHSAGMLVCEPETASWSEISKAYGIKNATLYRQAQIDALKTVSHIIKQENIDCDPISEQLIMAAHDTRSKKYILRDYATRKAMRSRVDLLQDSSLQREIKSPLFSLGERTYENLSVNPLAFARGFARYLKKKGVRIYEQTPLLTIQDSLAITPNANISFDTLITCLGTYEKTPKLRRYLTTIAITRPLSQDILSSIGLADKDMFLDNPRRSFHYGKVTGDNRLLIGYGDVLDRYSHRKNYTHQPHVRSIKRFLKKAFPKTTIPLACTWSAPYAITSTLLPKVEIAAQKASVNGAGTQLASIACAEYVVARLLKIPTPLKDLFAK